MPRGVYDRSKTKEQRAAEKTGAEVKAAAPKKVGRPPGSGKKAAAAPKAAPVKKVGRPKGTKTAAPLAAQAVQPVVSSSGESLYMFSTVRQNLETLNALAAQFSDIPTIKTEIAAHIDILTKLRQEVFPVAAAETTVEKLEEDTTETTTVAANGQSQQYSNTVPLPPSPVAVPSMPTS